MSDDWGPPDAKPDPSAAILGDADTLAQVREETLRSLGPAAGSRMLYGLGLTEGLVAGLRLARGFHLGSARGARFAGPTLPVLFEPDGGDLRARFWGTLPHSPEAALHVGQLGTPEGPICFVSAGFAAGWFSEALGEDVLVREIECAAAGAPACRFEARRLGDWRRECDLSVRELLDGLDVDRLRGQARELALQPEPPDGEGDLLGRFDSMSPAAHVWGPVMILPYSGGADCEAALDAIRNDIGTDQVRVVVIDATGARLDPLEASGLAILLDRLESLGVESILAGLESRAVALFAQLQPSLALPVIAQDLSEGIAVGFQISHPCES